MTEPFERDAGGRRERLDARALDSALASPDPEVRRQVLTAVTGREPVALRARLVEALADTDWRVRAEAVHALSLAPLEPGLVDRLISVLHAEADVAFRNAAVDALASGGEASVKRLSERVAELDADARKLAADALARSGTLSALSPLEQLASDVDPNVAAAAIEAMAQVAERQPEHTLNALDRAMDHPALFVRLVALGAIAKLGLVLPWSKVEPHLAAPELVLTALQIAARLDEPRAAPYFARKLNEVTGQAWHCVVRAFHQYVEGSSANRRAAQRALEGLSPGTRQMLYRACNPDLQTGGDALFLLTLHDARKGAELLPIWFGADEHFQVVQSVVELLGDAAIELLVTTLTNAAEEESRVQALELLLRLAEQEELRAQVMAQVRAQMGSPSTTLLRLWLGALARWGDERDFRWAFESLATEVSPGARRALASVLETSARRYPKTATELVRSSDPGGPFAGAAAIVLGAIGEAVTGSVVNDYEFLQRALTHTEPAVRTHAVEAFSRVPTPLAVEAIAFAVTDDAPEVQLAALRALGVLFRSGDGVARARLLNLGREGTNVNLVMAALQALGSACDAELLPDFGELVMHPDSWRALAAVNALKGYKAELRLPLLRRALLHDDAEVVKAAIELLPMSEPVLADLQHCLRHTAWSVRRAAADQMAHVRLPGAAEVLNFRLTLEREPQVIEAIHRSLSQLNRPSIATWSRRPGERGSGE